jgi:hypothetical protein
VTATQLDLNILLIFFGVRRVDFGVFGSDKSLEEVIRKAFRLIERHFHVAIELLGEGITVINPENPLKKVDINGDVEIFPSIVIRQLPNHLRDLLALEEDSLRNARILNLLLSDEDSLI